MNTLKIKLLVIFLALSSLTSGLVGGIVYFQYVGYIRKDMRADLEKATEFVKATLPYNSLSAYAKALDGKEPRAVEYREMMGKYAENTGLAFLYLVSQEGDRTPTVEVSNYNTGMVTIYWENPAPEALDALSTGEVMLSAPYTDEFGTFISLFTPLDLADGQPVLLGADLEVSSVKGMTRTALFSYVLSLLAGVALALIISVLFARTITKPVIALRDEFQRLAEADADLTVTLNTSSKDEIGQAAASFNAFVQKLNSLMREVKQAIEKTDLIKLNISSSAEETSTAIEQISANLSSINRQIDNLDAKINESVASINRVSDNTRRVDDRIISQSSMVEESTAAITEMMASLGSVNTVAGNKKESTQALSSVADRGREQITRTAENFKTVVDHIGRVQEMASAINGIAAQTNLLSMNAAIEAAHAGDSGRGFAVVAEEIRKLADSAGKSSQGITQLIKDITSSVTETDRNVASTREAFDSIADEVNDVVMAFTEIEQSVSELNAGGKQILESINQINDITATIRDGSEEISQGNQSMLEGSQEIKNISDAVTTGMAEAASGAGEIVKSMQILVEISQNLSTIVEELQKNFGQFKTD